MHKHKQSANRSHAIEINGEKKMLLFQYSLLIEESVIAQVALAEKTLQMVAITAIEMKIKNVLHLFWNTAPGHSDKIPILNLF